MIGHTPAVATRFHMFSCAPICHGSDHSADEGFSFCFGDAIFTKCDNKLCGHRTNYVLQTVAAQTPCAYIVINEITVALIFQLHEAGAYWSVEKPGFIYDVGDYAFCQVAKMLSKTVFRPVFPYMYVWSPQKEAHSAMDQYANAQAPSTLLCSTCRSCAFGLGSDSCKHFCYSR